MRLSLWFLVLVLLGGLPAQALELTLKTGNTTESIQDNGPKDQDQRSGFIQYQGILDKSSDSPFAISLRLAETSTKKDAKLSLEALPAQSGQELEPAVLNLGLPSTITIVASSTMAPLEGSTVGALTYRGAAVDESDGRQEVEVDKDEVFASFGATPLTVAINPVKGEASLFKFDQRQNIPLKNPVTSMKATWNLALGAGDGIKLDYFALKAEPAPSVLANAGTIGWAAAAGMAVLLFVIGFFTRRSR